MLTAAAGVVGVVEYFPVLFSAFAVTRLPGFRCCAVLEIAVLVSRNKVVLEAVDVEGP